MLHSGDGHQPWHNANFGPDADPGFGTGPTSILGTEPSEPVCVQAGSEKNSHMSDPWRIHFVLGCLKCYWKIL